MLCTLCILPVVHNVHIACVLSCLNVYFLGYAWYWSQVCVEVALGHLAFEHSAMCIFYIVNAQCILEGRPRDSSDQSAMCRYTFHIL